MAYSLLARPFPARELVAFVPRDRWLPDRWTGRIDLRLQVLPRHPLVIGAGWLDLEGTGAGRRPIKKVRPKLKGMRTAVPVGMMEDEAEELLVAEIVRRGPERVPVIPGSSLKGAVRQVYELLTPSCELGVKEGPRRACSAPPKDPAPKVCPVCSLFGAMGLAGRVSFQEGVPAPASRPVIEVRKVPKGWPGRKGGVGEVRVYDQAKAVDRDGVPRLEDEDVRSVLGVFQARVAVTNAEPDELGLLFACLGVGWSGPGPGLRLGGKKFHGFGGVEVQVVRAVQRHDRRRVEDGEAAQRWAAELRDRALDAGEARRQTWERLHRVLQEAEA